MPTKAQGAKKMKNGNSSVSGERSDDRPQYITPDGSKFRRQHKRNKSSILQSSLPSELALKIFFGGTLNKLKVPPVARLA